VVGRRKIDRDFEVGASQVRRGLKTRLGRDKDIEGPLICHSCVNLRFKFVYASQPKGYLPTVVNRSTRVMLEPRRQNVSLFCHELLQEGPQSIFPDYLHHTSCIPNGWVQGRSCLRDFRGREMEMVHPPVVLPSPHRRCAAI